MLYVGNIFQAISPLFMWPFFHLNHVGKSIHSEHLGKVNMPYIMDLVASKGSESSIRGCLSSSVDGNWRMYRFFCKKKRRCFC